MERNALLNNDADQLRVPMDFIHLLTDDIHAGVSQQSVMFSE